MERTDIIIPVYNRWNYTRACLKSIETYTPLPHAVIVVDNGSTDGTGDRLKKLKGIKVITNSKNLGFPKACNQGIRQSSGKFIVLLNNDTLVTPRWLENMLRCMNSCHMVGMVGPCSNYAFGVQYVPKSYKNLKELKQFAAHFNRPDPRKWKEVDFLSGFCLLIKIEVIEKVGLLDERFELGTFEDNDYCERVKKAGYKLVCVGDTFIHHFGSRTFKTLKVDYNRLFLNNRIKFHEKWRGRGGEEQYR